MLAQRNGNMELASPTSIETMHSLPADNEIQALEKRASEIRESLQFVYERESKEYLELIYIQNELFRRTKKVIYLIDICRFEKKMFTGGTAVAKRAAALAFKTRPSEKTLLFFLANFLINKSYGDALSILADAFEGIREPNLLAVRDMYEASLHSIKGDYYTYNSMLMKAKKKYVPGLYWQMNLVVDDFYLGSDQPYFLNTKRMLSFPDIVDKSYIISVSCDEAYFNLYARIFLQSALRHNPSAMFHLYLINVADKENVERRLVEWGVGDATIANYFDCPPEVDFRPVSASMRMLVIHDLLEKYEKPVFFCEIDCVVKKGFDHFVEQTALIQADQLIRVIGSYLPWQRNTCGFGLYMPTLHGRRAAALLSQYLKGICNRSSMLFWADQCALEASIRYSKLIEPSYNLYQPQLGILREYIVTPTGGSHEKKLAILNKHNAI